MLRVYGDEELRVTQSHPLPVTPDGTVTFLGRLPQHVSQIRIRPGSGEGSFSLRDVRIREIGIVPVAVILFGRHLQPVRFDLRRLVGFARSVWRNHGHARPETWKRWLFFKFRQFFDYPVWVRAYDTLCDSERSAIRARVAALEYKPLISVIMPVHETPEEWLRRAIDSVRRQIYPHWEICIADDASSRPEVRRLLVEYQQSDPRIRVVFRTERGHISAASNSALDMAAGSHVAFLDHDDELTEDALYEVARELNDHPDAALVYSDEDRIDERNRRHNPHFKPDWNPELLRAQNYLCHLSVYSASAVREAGGLRVGYEGAQDWDLALRVTERVSASRIRHVPRVLYHWRVVRGSTALAISEKSYAREAQKKMLADHFERVGVAAKAAPLGGVFWRIDYPLAAPPPLATLILRANSSRQRLRTTLDSVRYGTHYPRIELLVVSGDAGADGLETASDSDTPRARVLFHDAGELAASAWNLAAAEARGEILVFLDAGVEALASDWLNKLVAIALRPDVGVVGPLVYSAEDTIECGPVILGLHAARGYAFRGLPKGYMGPMGRGVCDQNVSVAAGPCLALRREIFETARGFDQGDFAPVFHEVDLSLRLRDLGYRNVWTSQVELRWDSGGSSDFLLPGQGDPWPRSLRERWGELLRNDPVYNPNLALEGEGFNLAFPPRRPSRGIEADRHGAGAIVPIHEPLDESHPS